MTSRPNLPTRTAVVAAGILLGSAPARPVVAPRELSAPEVRPPAEAAPLHPHRFVALPSLGKGWSAWIHPRTGMPSMAWGGSLQLAPSVSDAAEAQLLARDFLISRADLLGTFPDRMRLRSVRVSGDLWAVWFRQVLDDVPLRGAEAFVLLTRDGKLAALGSTFHTAEHHSPPGRIPVEEAIATAVKELRAPPSAARGARAEALWMLAPVGEELLPVPAWAVVTDAGGSTGGWETVVDARNGNVLSRRSLIRSIDVVGDVRIHDVEPVGYCGSDIPIPGKGIEVRISDGSSGVSDATGSFVVPYPGALPVILDAEIRGPLVDVNRASWLGPDASFQSPATPGVPIRVVFDDANSFIDERNVLHHTLLSNAFVKLLDPTLTELDYPMPVTVRQVGGLCPGNAWWDGVGMHFCDATAQFGSTSRMETVIHHEYGHGITDVVYARNGATLFSPALDEGNADFYANLVSETSQIGRGWFANDCNSYVRDSENDFTWPDDVHGLSPHDDGRIIAGFLWDMWESMLQGLPAAMADSLARTLWHRSRDLGTPQDMAGQVLWTFLADDDDGDLGDGSPRFDHICQAAQQHGFECPEPTTQVEVQHVPLPHVTDGSAPFDVVATVVAPTGSVDPASVVLHYRVNGRPFVTVPLAPTGPADGYAAQIPAQPPLSRVEYYLFAANDEGHTTTHPPGAPSELHSFDVAWLYDDLETAAGWTAGDPGDDAVSGRWGHFDPVGTLAQPEDDRTPDPGRRCFLTGQCLPGFGTCWAGCTLGCNDVDGGRTTLTSPVYDLTGAGHAVLRYDRWFSNDLGANPREDPWIVDVSNDGGQTWTRAETLLSSTPGWEVTSFDLVAAFGSPGQVRVRFQAGDSGGPSLVEAAVDELRILAAFGPAVGADQDRPEPLRLSLLPSRPNPGRDGAEILYSIPERGRVHLALYDVHGRQVRTLFDGERAPGTHAAFWDARTDRGARVAPGVYFYRLRAERGSLTRKLTLAP